MKEKLLAEFGGGACGYMVVRVARQNFDEAGRGAFSKRPPSLGDVFYGGIQRMPWFELDEDYYSQTLPPDLGALRQRLRDSSDDFTGLFVSKSMGDTLRLYDYCNRLRRRNEVITFTSALLGSLKGVVPVDLDRLDWLGYDVVAPGNWSLLEAAVFQHPTDFASWARSLNGNGLFPSREPLGAFIADYRDGESRGIVEPLGEFPYAPEIVPIARLRM